MAKQNHKAAGSKKTTEQNTPAVTTPLVPAEVVTPATAETETPPAANTTPETNDQDSQAEQNTPGGNAGDSAAGGDGAAGSESGYQSNENAEVPIPDYGDNDEVSIVATDKSVSMVPGNKYSVSGHSAKYLIGKGLALPDDAA